MLTFAEMNDYEVAMQDCKPIRYLVNAGINRMLTLITQSGDVSTSLSYFG
jgi:hypothetical protein